MTGDCFMKQITADESIKQLLDNATNKIKEFEKEWQRTGEKFNLFKITKIETDEVKTCRVLAALLDPKGYHGMGSLYLDLFIKMILKKTKKDKVFIIGDANTAKISTNYYTEGRFIDIVIKDSKIFIPIEVKINADDQPDQVAAYAEFSQKKNNGIRIPVFYITKNGDKPSKKSTTNEADYECLSFKNDILTWLNDCYNETENNLPVKGLIKQFINAIKYFCEESEDKKMEKEIAELIIESPESIHAAVAINNALQEFNNESKVLFKNKILNLVKSTKPQAEEYSQENWHGICIPILNGQYLLYIDYNWKAIELCRSGDVVKPVIEEKLAAKMSEITHCDNEKRDVVIFWATYKGCYPGMENADIRHYDYELYRQYAKNHDDVVNKILSIVQALEKIENSI